MISRYFAAYKPIYLYTSGPKSSNASSPVFSNVVVTVLLIIVASPQLVKPSSPSCCVCGYCVTSSRDIIDSLGRANTSHSWSTSEPAQGMFVIPELPLLSLIGGCLQVFILIICQLCVRNMIALDFLQWLRRSSDPSTHLTLSLLSYNHTLALSAALLRHGILYICPPRPHLPLPLLPFFATNPAVITTSLR